MIPSKQFFALVYVLLYMKLLCDVASSLPCSSCVPSAIKLCRAASSCVTFSSPSDIMRPNSAAEKRNTQGNDHTPGR